MTAQTAIASRVPPTRGTWIVVPVRNDQTHNLEGVRREQEHQRPGIG